MTDFILPTYNRSALSFERGEGSWLFTETGERYLDFSTGIAVNALGHSHPALTQALHAQSQKIWHCSNLYQIPLQAQLAEMFCTKHGFDWAFFSNSGAEACELAVKMVRKYWHGEGQSERTEIVGLKGAFHGRSSAGIAASGGQNMVEGFAPLLPGFSHVEHGNIDALARAIGAKTAAIIIEPIQGEGGIRPLSHEYLQKAEALCREEGVFFIADEVQCGAGRTGRFFGHEWAGIKPDIVMMGKGIGAGFPLGAILANARAATHMRTGTHGSTYGGNPLAMAVGIKVHELISSDDFLRDVERKSRLLVTYLDRLVAEHSDIFHGHRGRGLMQGLKCKIPPADFIAAARQAHLLAVPAKDNVVRLLPPLTVSDAELETAYNRLCEAALSCRAKMNQTLASP